MEAEDEQATSPAQERRMGSPANDAHVRLGFVPEVPLYEISGAKVRFGIGRVMRALFESTYRDPIALPLEIEDIIGGEGSFSLIVTSVQQVYPAMEHDHQDMPVGCYNDPEWLVRGHLAKSPHDPYPEFIWVIALIRIDGSDKTKIDTIEVQLIRDGIDGPRPW